jgi:SAM-dependent methyltransferase
MILRSWERACLSFLTHVKFRARRGAAARIMITHRKDGNRTWPIIPARLGRVLDLGCGNGEALREQQIESRALLVGLDVDASRTALASQSGMQASFCCGSGDALPFANGSFDAVFSRVALPYMNIPKALSEVFRVLRPEGEVWLSFHRFGFGWSLLLNSLAHLRLIDAMFRGYVIVNGLCFECTGRNFAWPLKRKRYESVQSEAGILRALARAGFQSCTITQKKPLVLVASKPAQTGTGHLEEAQQVA